MEKKHLPVTFLTTDSQKSISWFMTQENKKPLKCVICDYSSAQNATLKRHHESVHEKTELFKCEICDYSCAQNGTLKRHHEAVHDGT